MADLPPQFDVASRVERAVGEKTILWPTAIGYGNLSSSDSSRFPCLAAIKARHGAPLAQPLHTFVNTIMQAQDRILVLDDYLFDPREGRQLQPRIDQILSWLPLDLSATDVRFLTKAIANDKVHSDIIQQFEEHAKKINSSTPYAPGVNIEIRFTLNENFPYVHDRFAVIDDELWHFGATVGGLHEQVNAATRGWLAVDHDACTFFEIAWKGDQDIARPYKRRAKKR
jgi:hypothetical protein